MKPPCIKDGVPCKKRYPGCQDRCPDMDKLHEHNRAIKEAREKEYEYKTYAIPLILNNRLKNAP